MQLGPHDATVKIRFSYLVSAKIKDVTEVTEPATPAPGVSKDEDRGTAAAPVVNLLDGKLKIDIPSDFVREADDPKDPKTVAKFSREDGAWGQVLRGTHGLTPDALDGYLKKRVAEYSKGFALAVIAEGNRDDRWPQVGRLALRPHLEEGEGLSAQPCLHASSPRLTKVSC